MIKRHKHVTLSEVAKLTGVGTTTVSRAINGGQNVDPKTLARVQKAIKLLGYMPNQAARTLKGDRTRTVGLIIPSIVDPFFAACAEAAQAVARAHDSVLIVLTTQNQPETERDAVNVLLRHRADGFIIAPAQWQNEELKDLLSRIPIPAVALDRPLSGSPIGSVLADNFAGAQLATRHLLEHGYRRILCLTGGEADLYTIGERIRGYRETMAAAGLEGALETSIHGYTSAEVVLKRIFAEPAPPDALFTLKNSTTIFSFEALQRLDIAVPSAVALLGFDDFELADTVRPSISVIQQPMNDIGRCAAEMLFEQLLERNGSGAHGQIAAPAQLQLKTSLIRRSSCGCTAEVS